VQSGSSGAGPGRGRFSVTGIDNSAELLTIARAGAPQARFVNASICEVEIPCCQAIIAVGEPLTYHAEDAEADRLVQSFFERASTILPPGGVLIFDVIETGEPSLSGRFWSSGEDWAVLSQTSEDQSAGTLVRTIETFRRVGDLYRRGREIHHVRLFETRELSKQLAGFGFAVQTAQAYGAHPLAPRRRAFFVLGSSERRLLPDDAIGTPLGPGIAATRGSSRGSIREHIVPVCRA
jgi:hypothetical protein